LLSFSHFCIIEAVSSCHATNGSRSRAPTICIEEYFMNLKKLVCLLMAAVSSAILVPFDDLVRGAEESTMKYMVIRLLEDSIDPPQLTIKQGTVIIWVNEAHETAHIQFANKEMASCLNGSSVAGSQSGQGIFLKLDFGRTESICLVQKGEFSYKVTRGSQHLPGTIIVK
jgi:plastocyanin